MFFFFISLLLILTLLFWCFCNRNNQRREMQLATVAVHRHQLHQHKNRLHWKRHSNGNCRWIRLICVRMHGIMRRYHGNVQRNLLKRMVIFWSATVCRSQAITCWLACQRESFYTLSSIRWVFFFISEHWHTSSHSFDRLNECGYSFLWEINKSARHIRSIKLRNRIALLLLEGILLFLSFTTSSLLTARASIAWIV